MPGVASHNFYFLPIFGPVAGYCRFPVFTDFSIGTVHYRSFSDMRSPRVQKWALAGFGHFRRCPSLFGHSKEQL